MNKTIAILGAGTMGAKIAKCYAESGYSVNIYSRSEKTLSSAREVIGEISVTYTTDVEEAVKGAFYVVETIAEIKEAKKDLYIVLDRILPQNVIISSNTSYMNIFEYMPERRLEKTCIVHWFSPADILPLVEVVKGEKTSEDTMEEMMRLHKDCGKSPVRMEKFVPGFMVNRLQSAMNREVLFLLSNGYCTPESLDTAVKTSLMPRGLLLGVVQRMDFNGLDMVSHGILNGDFQPAPAPDENNAISVFAKNGDFGIKTGKGFYDYEGLSYPEAVRLRDERLKKSVELAKEFIDNPIGKKREN